jgi:hypothetical protein
MGKGRIERISIFFSQNSFIIFLQLMKKWKKVRRICIISVIIANWNLNRNRRFVLSVGKN